MNSFFVKEDWFGANAVRRRHHGKDEDEDDDAQGLPVRGALPEAQIIFTDDERITVTDWFRANADRRDLPPGLAKRDRLPPGLEKQLRERGTLPPGLQKRVQPLPIELDRRLPRLPGGSRRVSIGGDIVLMNDETAVVCDIIWDAVQ